MSPLDAEAVSQLVEAWDLIGPELVRLGLARLSDAEAEELTALLARWSPPIADNDRRLDEVLRFSELSMLVFHLLATASANPWLRASFDQLSDQMSRLWVTLLRGREVPEQLQQLMNRWNQDIAGRRPDEIAESLPLLIRESGQTAQDLFRRLGVTHASPRT
ncbi:FCD domain-containing protein [Geodermatophilus sp. FMUSA9-8]|uniref:FCD domain-containing protein n=1 Tax=Geodermatophilus sp. FMUSA9-8 TaxID=3120155 RepID=UPI00300968ED